MNLRQLTGQSGREMGCGADGFGAQIDPKETCSEQLLDHIVGKQQEIAGDRQSESLCGLQIDNQREFGRLLDWVGGDGRRERDGQDGGCGLPSRPAM